MKVNFDKDGTETKVELSAEDLAQLDAGATLDNVGIQIRFGDDVPGIITSDECEDQNSDSYEHGRQDGIAEEAEAYQDQLERGAD